MKESIDSGSAKNEATRGELTSKLLATDHTSTMMLSASRLARTVSRQCVKTLTSNPQIRLLSSENYDDFQPSPPDKLTTEMAEGIGDATQFYIRYGLSNKRLRAMAEDEDMPVVIKWQKMMEIFLTTQVHVVAGMGYGADEQGLTQYAKDLAQCIHEADETMQELFTETRRDTWRELVATAFNLDVNGIPTLSIVDARNLMHKVSSKMVEPDVLLEIQTLTAKIEGISDEFVELGLEYERWTHALLFLLIQRKIPRWSLPKSIKSYRMSLSIQSI